MKNSSAKGSRQRGRRIIAAAVLLAVLLIGSVALLRLLGGTAPSRDPGSLSAGYAEPRQAVPNTPQPIPEDDLPPPGATVGNGETGGEAPESAPDPDAETANNTADGFVLRAGAPAPPGMAWNLTKTDYEAVLTNPDADDRARGEAGLRHRFNFHEWPGRDAPYLAGFEFNHLEYPELREFEVNVSRTTVELIQDNIGFGPPLVRIDHLVELKGADVNGVIVWVKVDASVFSSAAWAQRGFLAWLAGMRSPLRPSRIGDVWYGYGTAGDYSARLAFTRHNVLVKLQTNSTSGEPPPYWIPDLEQVATRMDRKIRTSAIHARTWEDLSEHRPRIERFELDRTTVIPVQGKSAAKVTLKARPPQDTDESVSVYLHGESPVRAYGDNGDRWAGLFLDSRQPPIADEKECRLWAVAYLPNLLFTVAETTVLVKPAPDDGN